MPRGEIVFIEGEHGARFPDSNSLFIDDDLPTVIDPATHKAALEQLARDPGVKLVINSHYHVDHIRYNSVFADAEFAAHALDAPAIESLDENARIVGLAGKPWEAAWKQVMREQWGYRETTVSRLLGDGDELCLGANTLRFIHTPGHTPGHLCVEFLEKHAVYLADIDLTPFGPWYGNRASSIEDFLASIERLKRVRARTWYTCHGEGIIRGDIITRLDEYAAMVVRRDERILSLLAQEHSFEEIVGEALIYGKRWEPAVMFDFFEGTMVGKHLERLERRGLVERRRGLKWIAV